MRNPRFQEDPQSPGVVVLDTNGQPVPAQAVTGINAVAALQQLHPITGLVVAKYGYEMILLALESVYGPEEQNVKGKTLDKFFLLYRGNGALLDYGTAFKIRYEAAEEKTGLVLNEVGKTHLFLEHAGLNPKFVDDIMLKVDGD